MKSFEDLFVNELKDIYNTEKQYTTILLKMSLAANNPDLKETLLQNIEETQKQILRLEQVFKDIKENSAGSHSDAMDGLFREALSLVKSDYEPLVRDAALINCAQRIQHYQIALYGILKTFAKHLKLDKQLKLFDESLKEEKAGDKRLTEIAEGHGLNEQAMRRSA